VAARRSNLPVGFGPGPWTSAPVWRCSSPQGARLLGLAPAVSWRPPFTAPQEAKPSAVEVFDNGPVPYATEAQLAGDANAFSPTAKAGDSPPQLPLGPGPRPGGGHPGLLPRHVLASTFKMPYRRDG
jgi:hypothetical protein